MDVVLLVGMLLTWLVVGVGGWLVLQLVRQNGRILVEHASLEARIAAWETNGGASAAPEGLELGTPAPDFALRDLQGRERTLADFRGEPLLVVFFDPGCSFCAEMAPKLGILPPDGPRVLLVSRGEVEANRRLAEEHDWDCEVVVEDGWTVANAYRAAGTPTGYLLDAESRISSGLAVGDTALFRLFVDAMGAEASRATDGGDNGARRPGSRLAVRDVRESRINRTGLAPGTPAPDFELPDLEGRIRRLTDFRGRRVLLVFSDPECGPCQTLAPELVGLRHAHPELEVVIVSRGDPTENRRKAEEQGLDFPVVIQKGWRTSKAYGLFATPVAYLIDEDGVVAREPAQGRDAILAVAS